MTADEIKSNPAKFYHTYAWVKLRAEILRQDKFECQPCRERGRYSRGTVVHHINHVKARPEWALNKTYIDDQGNEQRNLITCCSDCHETVYHPERLRWKEKKKPLTEERW